VGLSVHNLEELAASDLAVCDYIGTGPAYPTRTKTDSHAVQGLDGLRAVAEASPLPMVAIGGITAGNAAACFDQGASGVAVISTISRADRPLEKALALGRVCGCPPRQVVS
jgi:thiamine-phosphate pyrophosphorylase